MKLSQFNSQEFINSTVKNQYHDYLQKIFKTNFDEKRYFEMFLIRTFEKKLLEAFSEGYISGTTHTYIGQECNSVALFEYLNQDDIIWSNHRCHGHFIYYCRKILELMAEIFGRKEGICQGRGGSQHLNFKNFYSNGILGGAIPQAVGGAFSLKKNKKKNISVVFIGDGTMGEGILYESLNLSSLLDCPILFVCENNFIALTTSISQNLAGSIKERVLSFNIKYENCDTYDFEDLLAKSKEITKFVRDHRKPAFIEISSLRLGPHSKSDDTRDKQTLDNMHKKDILIKLKNKINSSNEIEKKTIEIVNEIYSRLIK